MPTWILAGTRSPFGKYKGTLSSIRADDLSVALFNALADYRPEAVFLGCANQAGEDSRNVARLSVLRSTLSDDIPAVTLNSLCGSSGNALEYGFLQIQSQRCSKVLVAGLEHMTRSPLACLPPYIQANATWQDTTFGSRFHHPDLEGTLNGCSMLHHADEAVSTSLTRQDLEAYALLSHQRYFQSLKDWQAELFPLKDKAGQLLLDRDEAPRADLNLNTLRKLKPLREGGIHTAGHVAPYADGVAGVILSADSAPFKSHKEQDGIALELVDLCMVGTPAEKMTLAGLNAFEVLQKRHAFDLNEVACFEFHEAFASAHLMQCHALGLNPFTEERINRRGGSLAVGSPMGATTLRSLITLAFRLSQEGTPNTPYGVATVSIGLGMGISMLLRWHRL
jgi:acetyl-CoA acyltransferase